MAPEPEKPKVAEPRPARNVPWVEKYRPTEFSQIVGNQAKPNCRLFVLIDILVRTVPAIASAATQCSI
jgi:hypothetical protein